MSLTEFLLSRIAEDEADVEDSADRVWEPQPWALVPSIEDRHGRNRIAISKARPLAECEAKRRIISGFGSECGAYQVGNGHHPEDGPGYPCDGCAAAKSADAQGAWVLGQLALPYADHPDFDPAWRV